MVSVHAPPEDQAKQVKEEFYQSLEKIYDSTKLLYERYPRGTLLLKLAKNRLHIQPGECTVFMIYQI